MEHFSTGGGVHHLSGIFVHKGGGGHHLNGIFIQRVGVHHLSGIYIQRGGGTPPRWNIYAEGGCTATQWNIYPHGGGYTTSVEYLSGGGGTPPQWNIYPEGGGVQHLSGIFFPGLPFSPMLHFFTLFFLWGGAVPLCCMVSHSSQLSIFMMVFFLVGGCVARGGGGVADFSLSLSGDEGRKGGVGYHTFIRLLLRCVLFYVLDTRCQIRLQTSDFIHIAALCLCSEGRGTCPSVLWYGTWGLGTQGGGTS